MHYGQDLKHPLETLMINYFKHGEELVSVGFIRNMVLLYLSKNKIKSYYPHHVIIIIIMIMIIGHVHSLGQTEFWIQVNKGFVFG